MPATKTLTQLAAVLGADSDQHEKFKGLRDKLIELVITAGSRNVRPRLADDEPPETVANKSRMAVSVQDKDLHVEHAHYKRSFEGGKGDPRTTGLGHQTCRIDGLLGVLVLGAPVRTIRRRREAIVDVNTTIDDGSLRLSETQAQDTAAAIFQGFSLPARALG